MMRVIFMARTTQAEKQATHARIVRAAAAAIRKDGYDGASVAAIMEAAGLTHGGFYAHFASRDAMLAEAMDQAAGESLDRLGKVSDAAAPAEALDAVVTSYLSDRHVAAPEAGCTIAALGSETRRQTPEVRRIATRRAKELADLIARQLPGWSKGAAHDEALGVMSAMVGALVIARLVDDPEFGAAVRASAARLIRAGARARKQA